MAGAQKHRRSGQLQGLLHLRARVYPELQPVRDAAQEVYEERGEVRGLPEGRRATEGFQRAQALARPWGGSCHAGLLRGSRP
eukprot:393671-Pyramimonas_sp.AAC.1